MGVDVALKVVVMEGVSVGSKLGESVGVGVMVVEAADGVTVYPLLGDAVGLGPTVMEAEVTVGVEEGDRLAVAVEAGVPDLAGLVVGAGAEGVSVENVPSVAGVEARLLAVA